MLVYIIFILCLIPISMLLCYLGYFIVSHLGHDENKEDIQYDDDEKLR